VRVDLHLARLRLLRALLGDDFDPANLELGTQSRELVLVEVVLDRQRVQRCRVDDTVVLGVLEEGGQVDVRDGVYLRSSSVCLGEGAAALEAVDAASLRHGALDAGVCGMAVRAGVDHQFGSG
jgi:hypothetical protein